MKKLNKNEIVQFIQKFTTKNGYPPTGKQMGIEFKVSAAAISYQMKQMREIGLITYDSTIARSVRVVSNE